MTEKRKQNPYRRIERIADKVGEWATIVVFALVMVALIVVYPIYAMIQGIIWYEALIPLWCVIGVILLLIGLVSAYAVVRTIWNNNKNEWERKNRG